MALAGAFFGQISEASEGPKADEMLLRFSPQTRYKRNNLWTARALKFGDALSPSGVDQNTRIESLDPDFPFGGLTQSTLACQLGTNEWRSLRESRRPFSESLSIMRDKQQVETNGFIRHFESLQFRAEKSTFKTFQSNQRQSLSVCFSVK